MCLIGRVIHHFYVSFIIVVVRTTAAAYFINGEMRDVDARPMRDFLARGNAASVLFVQNHSQHQVTLIRVCGMRNSVSSCRHLCMKECHARSVVAMMAMMALG